MGFLLSFEAAETWLWADAALDVGGGWVSEWVELELEAKVKVNVKNKRSSCIPATS